MKMIQFWQKENIYIYPFIISRIHSINIEDEERNIFQFS